MIGYVIVGVIAFAVGEIVGVFVASLGQAAKERDELGKFSDDLCHGVLVLLWETVTTVQERTVNRMMKLHKKSTLMNWTRRELVDHIMMLEHNNQVMEETFEQQYKNCMQIIRDMDIFNKTYKERHGEYHGI